MPAVWFASDHHFGHEKTCTVFKRDDGSPLRPFANAEEMDETMIRLHNERVKPKDKCYFLGDVVIARKSLAILDRLNGDKVLIKGNHDIFKLGDYTKHFRDIRGYHVMSGLILSHVPVHPDSIERFGCNVHGHLHFRRVMKDDKIDSRYFNVSVECVDFAPISLEELRARIIEQGGGVEMKKSRHDVD